MSSEKIFEEIRKHFGEAGFNLTVKIRSVDYDGAENRKEPFDFVEGAKSIILTGFAGRTFWDVFNLFLADNSDFKENHEDLIDDYTRLIFGKLNSKTEAFSGKGYKIIFPFGKDALELDFVKLGILGGIGVPSILGILLHPVYGTWISLRGAIITDVEFEDYDSPLVNFDPCPSCDEAVYYRVSREYGIRKGVGLGVVHEIQARLGYVLREMLVEARVPVREGSCVR